MFRIIFLAIYFVIGGVILLAMNKGAFEEEGVNVFEALAMTISEGQDEVTKYDITMSILIVLWVAVASWPALLILLCIKKIEQKNS